MVDTGGFMDKNTRKEMDYGYLLMVLVAVMLLAFENEVVHASNANAASPSGQSQLQ